MKLEQLLQKIESRGDCPCLVYRGNTYGYGDLGSRIKHWTEILVSRGIGSGEVVGLKSDYSFDGLALFLALLSHRCVAAMVPPSATEDSVFLQDGQAQGLFRLPTDGPWTFERASFVPSHPLLAEIKRAGHGGFVIFSSGSTGKPKAILHDVEKFLKKFENANKKFCTLAFLLFDHIAGQDTLFYALASGGALVLPERRDSRSICELIQNHRVEVLPASPTFLRMLCLSGDYEQADLSSLKVITYGSEPMDANTLSRIGKIAPGARIVQKYGMSELGSPQSKSQADTSLWMKMDSEAFRTKIVDGILWIKAESAMMGYLNAPSPFDSEGWLCTGDSVETDGEWMRVLGRKSEIIMVGGEKVYPHEVEAVILELDNIQDAIVKGEPHPMVGQMVTAKVFLKSPQEAQAVLKNVRMHCRSKLQSYKIPVKVEISPEPLTSERHKKIRSNVNIA